LTTIPENDATSKRDLMAIGGDKNGAEYIDSSELYKDNGGITNMTNQTHFLCNLLP
jgi:hypothetical protein